MARGIAPSPIYEGEDSVIAYILSGPDKNILYHFLTLMNLKEHIRNLYKEHSAEYQSQALIDLARSLNKKISNINDIDNIVIETSHHTHYVIGTVQTISEMDPKLVETLDHSIMYIFAVALKMVLGIT